MNSPPSSSPSGPTSRAAVTAALALVALVVAIFVAHALVVNRVTDDCFISFRYAKNWAEGFGPVFNRGETPRVEGYTNFLWTALLALVKWARPGADLLAVARGLSIACAAGVVLLVGLRAAASIAAPWWLLAPLFVAFHAPFVAWSTGALETPLYTLLVFGACVAELRTHRTGERAWLAPLLLALATLTRPDGVVFLVALGAFRLWPDASAARRGARPVVALAAVAALVVGPWWLWRWHYYGWPLPNTFYAKVGGGTAQWWRGVDYVSDFLGRYGGAAGRVRGVLLLLPVVLALLLRRRDAWTRLASFMAAAGVGYVVAVGGESLGFHRFLVPVAPFVAWLVAAGLADAVELFAPSRGARRVVASGVAWGFGGALLVLGGQATLGPRLWPDRFQDEQRRIDRDCEALVPITSAVEAAVARPEYFWFDNYFVERLRQAALWIDGHAPGDALVAATPAGSIGYHMRQPLLDMLGLNDEHIAHVHVEKMGTGRAGHEKGDGAYVLSRRPRFVLLDNVAVFDHPLTDEEVAAKLRLKSEHEVWASPEFHRDYVKRTVRLAPRGLFQWFTFYERRDAEPPR
jgi:hypothetical protein